MIKKLFFAVMVIGICAALLWWLWGKKKLPEPDPELGNVAQPVQSAQSPKRDPLDEPNVDANDPNLSEKLTQQFFTKAINSYYSRPIEIYGKLIDQYQQPIAGANISLTLDDQPFGANSQFQAKSDSAGRFQLTNVSGARVIVAVSMDGYHAGEEALQGFSPVKSLRIIQPSLFCIRSARSSRYTITITVHQVYATQKVERPDSILKQAAFQRTAPDLCKCGLPLI